MKFAECKRTVVLAVTFFLETSLFCGCGQTDSSAALVPEISEDNRLVLFTSHKTEVWQPVIEEFENRTGIAVDVTYGGTTQLMSDIQDFGIGDVDVMFGGGAESYDTFADCFEPYQTVEEDNIEAETLSPDHIWTPFTELPLVFIYNTRLLTEEEAPGSWEALLEEEAFRGKIAFADPDTSGTSVTILAAIPQILQVDPIEATDQLALQLDGKICSGSGEVCEKVEDGTFLVGITIEETAKKRIAAGADLGILYPKEGTCNVPDAAAIVKDAPHRENAEAFIDFTVSREIQGYIQDTMYRRSIRTDLASAEEDLHIIPFDYEWTREHGEEIMTAWESSTEAEQ